MYIENLKTKMDEIPSEFYETPAIMQNTWKAALNSERHVITRHAMHSIHHKICKNHAFHSAATECICRMCNVHASQYHILSCKNNMQPLRTFAESDNLQTP